MLLCFHCLWPLCLRRDAQHLYISHLISGLLLQEERLRQLVGSIASEVSCLLHLLASPASAHTLIFPPTIFLLMYTVFMFCSAAAIGTSSAAGFFACLTNHLFTSSIGFICWCATAYFLPCYIPTHVSPLCIVFSFLFVRYTRSGFSEICRLLFVISTRLLSEYPLRGTFFPPLLRVVGLVYFHLLDISFSLFVSMFPLQCYYVCAVL